MPKLNLLEKLWCEYSDDVGKALIHLGAAGWFFSATAQIGMIIKNKDIDKKEKRFLVPQETADGIINVALYYTICQAIKNFGEYIVENLHLTTKDTAISIRQIKRVPSKSITEFVRGMAESFRCEKLVKTNKHTKNLSDFYKGAIAYIKAEDPIATAKFNNKYPNELNPLNAFINKYGKDGAIEKLQAAQKSFNRFKNGIGVIAAVGASIIACNLITPYARNLTANYYQKKMQRHNERTAYKPKVVPYKIPISQTFDKFKI